MVLIATLVSGVPARACGDPATQPRVVLALFDGRTEAGPRATRLHRLIEFELNHLGYTLRYVDAAAPLPDESQTRVAAVVSWFDRPLPDAGVYLAWRARLAADCGETLREIVFGHPGVPLDPQPDPARDQFLARLGLAVAGPEQLIGERGVASGQDAALLGFEADFIVQPGRYARLQATAAARSHLRLLPSEGAPADQGVDLVVTAPRGLYAHGSAAVAFDDRAGAAFWILDPFAFLEAGFGTAPHPVPDVTTLDGRRIFFGTVSAEGWLAQAPARQFGQDTQIGAEELRDKLLLRYPDLPMTVGIVTGDLDPALGGRLAARGKAAAEAIFALPQVSAATAGKSGVRRWAAFATETATPGAGEAGTGTAQDDPGGIGLVGAAVKDLGQIFSASGLNAFKSDPRAPRRYGRDPFDLQGEIAGALRTTSRLAPEGKRAEMMFWAGDAQPFEAALAVAARAGAASLGGGGGVYSGVSAGLAGLSAFSAPVGAQLQVYDALSGDDAYTNYRTTPSYGYQALGQTLDRTETPRRLKPFQLSFTAGSAIGFGTRDAVRGMLDRAQAGEVIPVTAAQYAAVVAAFPAVRIQSLGPLAWRIASRGALQTLRFDGAAGLALDLDASAGVLGARRKGAALYVALAPDADAPVVRLTRRDDTAGMVSAAGLFGLRDSRVQIRGLRREGCATQIGLLGWGAGEVTLVGPPGRSFDLRVTAAGQDGKILASGPVASDARGWLKLAVPALQGQPGVLRLDGGC